MQKHHVTRYEELVHAPINKVWEALTNPEIVKQYFFGSEMVTTWEIGSPILFRGQWEGQEYCDKGEVLEYFPLDKLAFSYLSSWSNKEDLPENYLWVGYEVKEQDRGTLLSISQSNYTEALADHSKDNWRQVVEAMKKILEN